MIILSINNAKVDWDNVDNYTGKLTGSIYNTPEHYRYDKEAGWKFYNEDGLASKDKEEIGKSNEELYMANKILGSPDVSEAVITAGELMDTLIDLVYESIEGKIVEASNLLMTCFPKSKRHRIFSKLKEISVPTEDIRLVFATKESDTLSDFSAWQLHGESVFRDIYEAIVECSYHDRDERITIRPVWRNSLFNNV